ncbi:MAG: acyl-CoA dehydrogenase family protein [Dehalococcoidia bacterium]|nr:acyl-CoA dehydrogenase family protein [Dehalococcoidia bacterium]
MDFNLTEQQEMFQKSIRRFAEAELTPVVDIMDKQNEYPFEIRPKLAAMNLLGIPFDPKYGGGGADHVCLVLAMEEVARVLAPMAISMQVGNVTCDRFNKLGTEKQKQEFMIPICENRRVVCFAFTEPDTGSNPKMIKTTARSTADGYIINGTKRFITHGTFADASLIFAKDDDGDISLFFVETDRPGFSTDKKMDKLGLRGTELCDLIMEDVHIPKENLLGGKGGKFDALKDAMTIGKMCLSAQCVGLMQASLDEAIKYSMHRMHFDEPIFDLQAIHWLLAEMACGLEASRWLTYRSAFLKDTGINSLKDMAITKLFATSTAVNVCRWGMQVHGAYGISKEYKIERLFRDAKMYELLEGTSEIQRELIVKRLPR